MCSEAVLPQELSGKKKKLPRGTEIKKLGFWGCPQVIRFCTFKTPSGAGAALKKKQNKNKMYGLCCAQSICRGAQTDIFYV